MGRYCTVPKPCIELRPQFVDYEFLISRPQGFSAMQFITIIFIFAYYKRHSNEPDKRSDERNANKHVFLLHSIQSNPSAMAYGER